MWETVLTAQGNDEASHIQKLSWRRTTRGGKIWVAPQRLTPMQRALLTNTWEETLGSSRTAVHLQVRGDSGTDPAPWIQWVAERAVAMLPTAGQWTRGEMGVAPALRQITPVAGIQSSWDGGLILNAATPEEANALAQRLNGLCVGGAGGSTRLGVHLLHDGSETQHANGRRSGKGGRGARRAGRPSA